MIEKKRVRESGWKSEYWPPLLFLASAFICVALFGDNEAFLVRQLSGTWFGYAIGLGMTLWARIHLREGRIKARGAAVITKDMSTPGCSCSCFFSKDSCQHCAVT